MAGLSNPPGYGKNSWDENRWARAQHMNGMPFVVSDANAWKPTVTSVADRSISISRGSGTVSGGAVFDETTTAETVQVNANSSAALRYDMIVARWDWTTRTRTFAVLQGNGSTPPTRTVNPGVLVEGLIAVVKVRPGVGTFLITDMIDARVYAADGGGGIVIPSQAALPYIDTRLGLQARLAGFMTEDGSVVSPNFYGSVADWVFDGSRWTWASNAQGVIARATYTETGTGAPRPGRTPLNSLATGLPAFDCGVQNMPAGRRVRVTLSGMMSCDAQCVYAFVLIFAGVQHRGGVDLRWGADAPVHFNITYTFETNGSFANGYASGGVLSAGVISPGGPAYLHASGFDGPTEFVVEDCGAVR